MLEHVRDDKFAEGVAWNEAGERDHVMTVVVVIILSFLLAST